MHDPLNSSRAQPIPTLFYWPMSQPLDTSKHTDKAVSFFDCRLQFYIASTHPVMIGDQQRSHMT